MAIRIPFRASKGVTVYARGRGKGGKTREIAKTAQIQNGALVVSTGYMERDL